ncbi:MAG: helix-turn-helix domain-containing protein [Sphingomicrobium sp.]
MGAPHPDGRAAPITRNIYRLIEQRGINKAQVHKAARIARSTFYDKLDNRPEAFTVEQLVDIADFLEVDVTELWAA